jgi:hypothetical protein
MSENEFSVGYRYKVKKLQLHQYIPGPLSAKSIFKPKQTGQLNMSIYLA